MFEFLRNLLFPPRCVNCQRVGLWLCQACQKHFEKSISFETSYYQVMYVDQTIIACRDTSHIIARFLYAWKYKRWLAAGEILQRIIAQAFFQVIGTSENIICVPIPLHKKKLQTRGFNQAELLLRELQKWSIVVLPMLLRKKATVTQVGLSRVQRQDNLKEAFIFDSQFLYIPTNTTIVLIDDVVTSGTTLSECAQVLRGRGFPHIVALVLHRGT